MNILANPAYKTSADDSLMKFGLPSKGSMPSAPKENSFSSYLMDEIKRQDISHDKPNEVADRRSDEPQPAYGEEKAREVERRRDEPLDASRRQGAQRSSESDERKKVQDSSVKDENKISEAKKANEKIDEKDGSSVSGKKAELKEKDNPSEKVKSGEASESETKKEKVKALEEKIARIKASVDSGNSGSALSEAKETLNKLKALMDELKGMKSSAEKEAELQKIKASLKELESVLNTLVEGVQTEPAVKSAAKELLEEISSINEKTKNVDANDIEESIVIKDVVKGNAGIEEKAKAEINESDTKKERAELSGLPKAKPENDAEDFTKKAAQKSVKGFALKNSGSDESKETRFAARMNAQKQEAKEEAATKNSSSPFKADTENTTDFKIIRMKNSSQSSMGDSKEGDSSAQQQMLKSYSKGASAAEQKSSSLRSMPQLHDIMPKMAKEARLMLRKGKSEMQIALKPDFLGKMKMKLVLEGDSFTGKFIVEHAAVKEMLEKNMDEIGQALKDMGVDAENFDVSLEDGSSGGELFDGESEGSATASKDGREDALAEDDVKEENEYKLYSKRLDIVI